MIELFLYALVLTIIIETWSLIILRELNFCKLEKVKLEKTVFAWFFASFATLPYLWFVWNYFLWDNYILYTIVWEISVVLIESIIFYFIFQKKYYRTLIISFIVNLVSYLFWLFIFS